MASISRIPAIEISDDVDMQAAASRRPRKTNAEAQIAQADASSSSGRVDIGKAGALFDRGVLLETDSGCDGAARDSGRGNQMPMHNSIDTNPTPRRPPGRPITACTRERRRGSGS